MEEVTWWDIQGFFLRDSPVYLAHSVTISGWPGSYLGWLPPEQCSKRPGGHCKASCDLSQRSHSTTPAMLLLVKASHKTAPVKRMSPHSGVNAVWFMAGAFLKTVKSYLTSYMNADKV